MLKKIKDLNFGDVFKMENLILIKFRSWDLKMGFIDLKTGHEVGYINDEQVVEVIKLKFSF